MTTGALSGIATPASWKWQELWATMPRIKEIDGQNLTPLSVYLDSGVVPRDSRVDNHNQLGEDLSRYLVVRPDDVVFNKLRTWQGGLGYSKYHGIVSPAYFVCRPKTTLDSRFIHYLLRSKPYLAELTRISKWMPPSQFDTPWETLRKLPLLLPPPEEQRRIADFLDGEIARIEMLVQLRSRQLDLLAERCAAALNQQFQDHSFRPTRLKYLLAVKPRYGVLVPAFADEGVRFIRVNDLLDLPGRADTLARIPTELSSQYSRTVTQSGDILLSVVGTMGRATVVPPELTGANVARAVASLRTISGIPPELIATWMTTPDFHRQAIEATASDTAQPTLGMEDLSNFQLAWPAETQIQTNLLSATTRIHNHQKSLGHALQTQQKLLTERRQALITAAVTGQFDVSTASGRNVTDGVNA
ncbi:restriction endonuclease subunit S [Streptomyces sp. S501]|uniref:restriction endonuclease subunit S n=1 Tax=Streptomyces sp. S501 TaxID=2420135 RepID=UPI00106EBD11|nr:restriction endonuclease subunit S [Streptomyces sp. S501]QBR09534.1 restriction endonuclease subunit S [Streptomyces sp. S501]